MSRRLHFGRLVVETSSEDKVMFPDAGITKGAVIDYYRRIAATMLPHLRNRFLTLQRFPDGRDTDGFYQQSRADYFPDFIPGATAQRADGGEIEHVCVRNAAGLTYLANQGTLTFHGWLSRRDRPDHPDRMIFDLDPPGDDFDQVREAARQTRELLEDIGLTAFVMTTGSRGVHVVVPLDRRADFDSVRQFAREVAESLAQRHPQQLTVDQRKARRRGRLYLDVMRNAYGQTGVVPYSLRAKSGAPVATPLRWEELQDPDLDARHYHIGNVFARLGQMDDPWRGMARHAAGLDAARRRLEGRR